ncbi:glycosyltransferase [Lonepinella sp. BR2271]|uniref:glycosyltransferase n=1 Tax=Lonepinella sp. BR2271 TaxID=3434550 RepID=UPI003F6E0F0D
MNFVFAADNNYLPHFETVLKSVMCYHENVNIFLFYTNQIDIDWLENIGAYLSKRQSKLFHYQLNEQEFEKLNKITNFSVMTYARYFIPRLFPYQKNNHWCYLDVDLVVNRNLNHIFDLMQQAEKPYAVAAVKDVLPVPECPDYFNAGVLFLDSNLWDLDEATLIQATLDNPNLTYPDQDVLNYFIGDQYCHLDKGYNYFINKLYGDILQFSQGKTHQFCFPSILHYIGKVKPWITPNSKKELTDDIYMEQEIIKFTSSFLYGFNLFAFYRSLPWDLIVEMPLNYFQPLAKQIYKQNFDYVVKGDADIEWLD